MSDNNLTSNPSKKVLCWIGLHQWESLADVFAFGRSWKHRSCKRCGKEQYV